MTTCIIMNWQYTVKGVHKGHKQVPVFRIFSLMTCFILLKLYIRQLDDNSRAKIYSDINVI